LQAYGLKIGKPSEPVSLVCKARPVEECRKLGILIMLLEHNIPKRTSGASVKQKMFA